jgi:hypothetical protein
MAARDHILTSFSRSGSRTFEQISCGMCMIGEPSEGVAGGHHSARIAGHIRRKRNAHAEQEEDGIGDGEPSGSGGRR